MDCAEVKTALRARERELKAIGVDSLSIFGSVARGDAGPDSDIDIAVKLADNFSKGGFDYFHRIEKLQRRLSTILGHRVDVIEEPVRKQLMQAEIDRDRSFAF
jgi:uncharacterized protein